MSCRSDGQGNQDPLRGFVEGLGLAGVEREVVELDAKHADPARVREAARRAVEPMDRWRPERVCANDDVAQSASTVRSLHAPTPIVHSGVDRDPKDCGFDTARNVTGVLEREHVPGSVALLRDIRPMPRLRIALAPDDDPARGGVSARIGQDLARRTDVEAVEWMQPRTFRLAKPDGTFADPESVQRWTVEPSRPPDLRFRDTRVERGTLCATTVDGVEQGRPAGRMARRTRVGRCRRRRSRPSRPPGGAR